MVSCTCSVGACSVRPMSGSDGKYMSIDSGPSAVKNDSSRVSAKVPGRSIIALRFPGVAQHEPRRSGALQNRDRGKLRIRGDPGSAVHRFALHRVRETKAASFPLLAQNLGRVAAEDLVLIGGRKAGRANLPHAFARTHVVGIIAAQENAVGAGGR